MLRGAGSGIPVCITVYAERRVGASPGPFSNHSMNYRSVVALGKGDTRGSTSGKAGGSAGLHRKDFAGTLGRRAAGLNDKELKATSILKLPLNRSPPQRFAPDQCRTTKRTTPCQFGPASCLCTCRRTRQFRDERCDPAIPTPCLRRELQAMSALARYLCPLGPIWLQREGNQPIDHIRWHRFRDCAQPEIIRTHPGSKRTGRARAFQIGKRVRRRAATLVARLHSTPSPASLRPGQTSL